MTSNSNLLIIILAKANTTLKLKTIYTTYIHIKESRERRTLNKAFRAELHPDASAYTSYGLKTAPSSLIGSKRVDVNGEASHPTLSIVLKIKDN